MPASRRTRRRLERARHKQTVPRPATTLGARLGMMAGGIVLTVGGIALLLAGQPGTAQRLSRLAGLMIIVGCALVIFAMYESVGTLGRR